MRKVPLAGAAAVLVLGVTSAVAIPIASQAAGPSPAKSKTLVFHDQLFSGSQHVGDDAGSCVIVDVSHILANCTMVIRLPGGTITGQFLNAPPPHKQIALTGGTGVYDAAGGDGTLVEFPNNTGRLTLHVLSLVARGGGG